MRFIALLGGLLLSAIATSATLTVEWSYPTTRVDGSPQPTSGPGALTSVRIEWGTCKGANLDQFGVSHGQKVVPYPQTSMSAEVSAGIKCARGFLKDNQNIEAAPSNLGRYFPAPAPIAIKSGTKIAYELRKKADGDFQFASVGTVMLNAKCGAKLASGFATISGAKITKPLTGGVIAAKCS